MCLPCLGQVRIDAEELVRRGVVIAVYNDEQLVRCPTLTDLYPSGACLRCAVRGVAASADRRSQFHPSSTTSSPGSARKNFWRVVIVGASPCGRTRQNFLLGLGASLSGT